MIDWKSGATAWVARKSAIPVLILRGVTDLVSAEAAEAEGNPQFSRRTPLTRCRIWWASFRSGSPYGAKNQKGGPEGPP